MNHGTLADGRYLLHELLGEGGMASVYVAHDSVLDVHRAIKVLAPRLCTNVQIRHRFVEEARAMARLKHPNIVAVHDVVVGDGTQPFIIMELVRGGSVGSLIEVAGPQSPTVAAGIMVGALSGLACSHENGIVHRDIKPDNVLMTRGGVAKITDFGIAQIGNTDHSLTRTGAVLGTIAYMAPEQRRDSKNVTALTDIYAAGAMLFCLLKGEDPFDLYAKELQHSLLGEIPEAFRKIITKACSFEPAERYATAMEMSNAIRGAAEELGLNLAEDGAVDLPESVREMNPGWGNDSDFTARGVSAETSDYSSSSAAEVKYDSTNRPVESRYRPALTWRIVAITVGIVVLFALIKKWTFSESAPLLVCGDGITTEPEMCDDGNGVNTDTCTNDCQLNVVFLHGATPSSSRFDLGQDEPHNERPLALAETPSTPLLIYPFWIDRHEVTREAFLNWADSVEGGRAKIPLEWAGERVGVKGLPANHISHAVAREYCQHLGGDTPTEGHWEYAARSAGQNIEYPWGDEEPSCELSILGRSDCSLGRSHPVCSRPKGNTEQGLCDMAGNVWEWARVIFPYSDEDEFPAYPGVPSSETGFPVEQRELNLRVWELAFSGLVSKVERKQSDSVNVIRGGGHWMTAPFFNRTRARYFLKKGKTEMNVGFRCIYKSDRFKLATEH